MNVCALVLAAGFSTRMAPRFKPLLALPLPEGERSALASVCGLYLAEGIPPLVVGGARAEDTRREALPSVRSSSSTVTRNGACSAVFHRKQ